MRVGRGLPDPPRAARGRHSGVAESASRGSGGRPAAVLVQPGRASAPARAERRRPGDLMAETTILRPQVDVLGLVEAGLHLHPVKPAAKTPLTPNGFKDATR